MLPKLNLPAYNPRLQERDGKHYIWDIIRKKSVVLTPEEWVRQHLLNLLTQHLAFSHSLIKVESQTDYWKKIKRSDIVTYDQEGKPYFLIECKSADQKINKKVLNQISVYNKSIDAPFIAVSNGINHFCWAKEESTYVQMQDFPPSPTKR